MTALIESLRAAASSGGLVAMPLALAGGVVAGLNPCCFPLYPAAVATCCAGRCDEPASRVRNSGAFVCRGRDGDRPARCCGGAGWARPLQRGRLGALRDCRRADRDGASPPRLDQDPTAFLLRKLRAGGIIGAFATGLLVSLVIAPCSTPVLASVLSFAAFKQSVAYGAALLFAYGFGMGLPLLVLGTASSSLARRLDQLGWRLWVDRLSGAALVALGFYLLWIA